MIRTILSRYLRPSSLDVQPDLRRMTPYARIHWPAPRTQAQTPDLVIGAVSGYVFDDIKYWVNSLLRCGFSGERVVIAYAATYELVDDLLERGFIVTTFKEDARRRAFEFPERGFKPRDVSINRFFQIWTYMTQADRAYRYAAFVDVRDLIFQTDPSRWLEEHLVDRRINVSSEGFLLGEEPWNSSALRESYGPLLFEQARKRDVLNAGSIAGDAATMADLALNIFLTSRHNSVPYTDQAALNLLLSLEPYRQVTQINDVDQSWACQAATTAVDSTYAAEHLNHRSSRGPVFDGQFVRTPGGEPYCLVHQYDRVPTWRDRLESRYSDPSG